jgi:type III secretory pathway component EscU
MGTIILTGIRTVTIITSTITAMRTIISTGMIGPDAKGIDPISPVMMPMASMQSLLSRPACADDDGAAAIGAARRNG